MTDIVSDNVNLKYHNVQITSNNSTTLASPHVSLLSEVYTHKVLQLKKALSVDCRGLAESVG